MPNKYIREVSHGGLVWVNVSKQGEKELAEVEQRFYLHHADVLESLPPFQRPKIIRREGYYFIILHFPVFDRETRRLGFTEVDFFLSPHWLITVHDNKLHLLEDFFSECRKLAAARTTWFTNTMTHVLFELWSRLLEGIFPILLHVNEDITTVDRKLFTQGHGREMVEEILRLKTNIVTFRRAMQGHRLVIERLIVSAGRELDVPAHQHYVTSLRDSAIEIWHMLESQKESINALHETNESMVGLHTNEVMKTLTVISVITFPLTLLATIFAIHAPGTPFVSMRFGFLIILLMIAAGALCMLAIFKKRNWM